MAGLNLGVMGAKRTSFREPNPRELMRSIIEMHPRASDDQLIAWFEEAAAGREDFNPIFREYFAVNCLRSLRPRSAAELAERRVSLSARVERMRERVRVCLLDWLMPNGKKLGDCTGGELRTMNVWCSKLAKGLGDNDILREHRSEEDVRKLAPRAWQ